MARKHIIGNYFNGKEDKAFRVVVNRCDICDDIIAACQDDVERKIDMLDEINDSYESEHDKLEPRLLLCDYCKKEYMIPAYPI